MDVEEIIEIPKKELKANTTRRLLEHLEELEQYFINEHGTLDAEKAWDEDEDAADQMAKIKQVLRQDRLEVYHRSHTKENQDRIERLEEENDGQQTAIDRLKVHGHEGGVETYSINYPGKRDN